MEKILENVNFRACFRVIFHLVPTSPPPHYIIMVKGLLRIVSVANTNTRMQSCITKYRHAYMYTHNTIIKNAIHPQNPETQ